MTIASGSLATAADQLKAHAAAGYLANQSFINDTADANITIGLTINQGANDDYVQTWKSSDVSHGMTDHIETDSFGGIKKAGANDGGLAIQGFSDVTLGLSLVGYGVTDITTKTTAGQGYVNIDALKKSGTGSGSPGADANLVAIRAGTTTRFIFDVEGSAHSDVEWTTFDAHDDVALLTGLELAFHNPLKDAFREFIVSNRQRLSALGIVHFEGKDTDHGMVNWTRLSMLLVGAVRQTSARLDRLERLLLVPTTP